jgi:hypothetical protein
VRGRVARLGLGMIVAAGAWGAVTGCSAIVGITDLPGGDGGVESGAPTGPTGPGSTGPGGPPGATGPTGPGTPPVDSGAPAAPDGAACALAPGASCSADPQCGCAAPGSKCDLASSGSTYALGCVAIGSSLVGAYCQTVSDCQRGLTCAANACRPFCAAASTACSGGTSASPLGQCEQLTDPNNVGIPGAYGCELSCVPWPMSCGSGLTCLGGVVNGRTVTDCEGAGTILPHGSCTVARDCIAGYRCTQETSTTAACLQWCRLGQADCATGTTCTTLTPAVVIGGITYGVCAP